jgi:hypothetical protein
LLEDVLGVEYAGTLGSKVTYLTPSSPSLAAVMWPQPCMSYFGPMIHAKALRGAQVLAIVTLPYVDPHAGTTIGRRWVSYASDPPAFTPGTTPACVINEFGEGRAVWLAAPFEAGSRGNMSTNGGTMDNGSEHVDRKLFVHLLREVLKPPYAFEADAHSSVEVTVFDQPEKQRLVISLLSAQMQLPGIPVSATVRVRLPRGKKAASILAVPDNRRVPFQLRGPYIEFQTGTFDPFAMLILAYH